MRSEIGATMVGLAASLRTIFMSAMQELEQAALQPSLFFLNSCATVICPNDHLVITA